MQGLIQGFYEAPPTLFAHSPTLGTTTWETESFQEASFKSKTKSDQGGIIQF